ncbi:hypothetical protein HMPREF3185_00042 [Porphyromonas somerae]|uniref:Uncharacterized protein n=1 Tax=Porphyromonas somerae TaxID=322095 RepID=A0A134BG40_9PORP|nr:hypothetical protein HMPREF3184_00042 [Porphyromonadaceae bacterium KA00676]KXB78914.1 hypothetical protein HMPREF3185_00042 [Porphyromonas somerae]
MKLSLSKRPLLKPISSMHALSSTELLRLKIPIFKARRWKQ